MNMIFLKKKCLFNDLAIRMIYQYTYLEHFSSGMVMGLQTCK